LQSTWLRRANHCHAVCCLLLWLLKCVSGPAAAGMSRVELAHCFKTKPGLPYTIWALLCDAEHCVTDNCATPAALLAPRARLQADCDMMSVSVAV
jgi:hypothetical protein